MRFDDDNSVMSDDRPCKMRRKNFSKNSQCQGSRSLVLSSASPFKDFKKSLEDLTSIVNTIVQTRKNGETCTLQESNKLDAVHSNKISSVQNIIIISDSDNDNDNDNDNDSDSDSDNDDNNETNDRSNLASLSVIECSPNIRKTPLRRSWMRKLRNKTLRSTFKQKKSRASVILLDDDSTCNRPLEHTIGSVNEKNMVSLQAEDDVIELWSCLGNSSKHKEASKCDRYGCKENNDFVIDTQPSLENLECLRMEEPEQKKRKTCRSASSKNCKTKKCSENDEEAKPYSNQRSKHKKHKSNSKHKLREIVVDGCNVAMAHTNGREFSEKGITLIIDYFQSRNHVVKVFLPQHVRRKDYKLIEKLYKEGTVIFTPSRSIAGRKITPYDDRYILEYATKCKGIVISSDQYRDLYNEKHEWRDTILNRLLSPTFVGDYVMFPEDPLGKAGPSLKKFLRY